MLIYFIYITKVEPTCVSTSKFYYPNVIRPFAI